MIFKVKGIGRGWGEPLPERWCSCSSSAPHEGSCEEENDTSAQGYLFFTSKVIFICRLLPVQISLVERQGGNSTGFKFGDAQMMKNKQEKSSLKITTIGQLVTVEHGWALDWFTKKLFWNFKECQLVSMEACLAEQMSEKNLSQIMLLPLVLA